MTAATIIHITVCEEYSVTGASGRVWRFDWHDYMGPTVLRSNGRPRERQSGPKSEFWPAFKEWLDSRKEKS